MVSRFRTYLTRMYSNDGEQCHRNGIKIRRKLEGTGYREGAMKIIVLQSSAATVIHLFEVRQNWKQTKPEVKVKYNIILQNKNDNRELTTRLVQRKLFKFQKQEKLHERKQELSRKSLKQWFHQENLKALFTQTKKNVKEMRRRGPQQVSIKQGDRWSTHKLRAYPPEKRRF